MMAVQRKKRNPLRRLAADPTPAKIRQECSKLREEWSRTIERKRSGKNRLVYLIPLVKVSDICGAFDEEESGRESE